MTDMRVDINIARQRVASPGISVIIPHLNQPEMLRRCLASLAVGARRPDEIIVVDNGSRNLPTDVCKAYPDVQLLIEMNPGPGPARNHGAAAARFDVLAFIDADCIADPEWLAQATSALADPDAMILGGDVRIALGDPQRITMLEAYESIFAYRMDLYIARHGFTGTGNLVVRRDVLDAVGSFAGIGVAEDREWGRRAIAKGHHIRFVPSMLVFHPARQHLDELFRKLDRQCAHDYSDAISRPGGRVRFALKALVMPVSPPAELPRIVASDRLQGFRARALAFTGLIRVRMHRTRIMLKLLVGTDPAGLSGDWNRSG